MGKNIKIICSVIPNGVESSNGTDYLKLSVFLTPRLPDSGTLNDYYEVLHWPEFADFFKSNANIRLEVAKIEEDGDNYKWPANRFKNYLKVETDPAYAQAIPLSVTHGRPAQLIWNCLFKHDTPVAEWVLDEGQYLEKVVHIYKSLNKDAIVDDATLDRIKTQTDKAIYVNNAAAVADAQNDISSNLMYEDEIRAKNRLNQEFHRKISILADHPHILRATGWILDYRVSLADADNHFPADSNIIKLSGLEILPHDKNDEKWEIFVDQIDFKTPWTFFKYEANAEIKKSIFSYDYAKKYRSKYFDIKNGYLNSRGGNYALLAEQYDRGKELANLQTQVKNVDQSVHGLSVDDYTGLTRYLDEQTDPTKTEKASEGIQIRLQFIPGEITPPEVKGENQPGEITISDDTAVINVGLNDNNALNIDNYVLFGHHIDTGYVVEVKRSDKDKFSSLCLRTADYILNTATTSDPDNIKPITILKDFSAEAWISEVAVAGKSGKIYADENICRWNNWSLVCQQQGKHPEDEGVNEQYLEFNDMELINARPKERSLIPLRFGQAYDFRIKIVDICGNSTQQDGPQQAVFSSSGYCREESVKMPEIYFADNIYREKSFLHPRAIPLISDKFIGERPDVMVIRSEGGEDSTPNIAVSDRSICPARVNYNFAELHGVFDNAWNNPDHQMIVYQKAAYHKDSNAQESFNDQDEIPFITDPVAKGTEFILSSIKPKNFQADFVNISQTTTKDYHFKSDDYLTKEFMEIRLKEGANKFEAEEDGKIVIGLRKAAVIEIDLKATTDKKFDPFLSNPNKASRKVTLIHAVRKPYLDGSKIPAALPHLQLQDRSAFKDNDGNIIVKFDPTQYSSADLFPFASSGEIWLRIDYTVLIVNRDKDGGTETQQIIKYRKIINSVSNDKQVLPALKYEDPSLSKFLSDIDINNLAHSLGDTKYYDVKYTLEGHSRFFNFFPQDNPDRFVYKQPIGDRKVLNSKKLKAPEIFSIVPVMVWDSPENGRKRVNNCFRIYFDNDWYESGQGEKIAVLFVDDHSGNVPDKIQSLVTSYGKDPTNMSARTYGLSETNFDTTEFARNVNFELLNFGPNSPADLQIRDGAEYTGTLKAAIFKVEFDKDQKRFFADVKLKFDSDGQNDNYMPFFKFAIAKYQQYSIRLDNYYDFCFSFVSQAPQVQQLPFRKLDCNADGTFTITGPLRKTSKDQDKPNQFYLIAEGKPINNVVDMSAVEATSYVEPIQLEGPMNKLKIKGKCKLEKGKYYLEEYEIYDVLDAGGAVIDITDENPRHDIRKRLISSFLVVI
ncbi:MAG: hypothetical protein JST50_02480 [Bacteroidetes bacterium]|nr:hypothetical protein [Bacteroidota bacterium]